MHSKMVSKSKAYFVIVLCFVMPLVLTAAATQLNLATQVQGILAVINGGTGIASGTSGGVLAYTATSTLASSGLLAANAPVVGGGAGVAPSSKSFADLQVTAYAAGGGTAQAQTVTLSPAATSLVAGLEVCWLPVAANTTAGPTLAVNGLTAKTITKTGTTALVANDITATAIACAMYDGTQFQLEDPQTLTGLPQFADQETPSGTINGSTTAFTLAHTPNPAASLTCFENGVAQRAAGADFTLATATMTYGVAPATGSTLVCNYRW